MPIKGITDAHTPGRGMERLGVLHKGAERTAEDLAKNRPGKDLTYFRIAFTPERESLLPVWEHLYGREPRTIGGAYLLGGTPDEALMSWLEEWGKSGLYHRCDGETQVAWFDAREGRVVRDQPQKCLAPNCACKQIGRLNFFLPEFVRVTGAFGYFTLQTHSIRDIRHVYGLLSDVLALAGSLFGVPLEISRVEEEIELPEMKAGKPTGKRMHVKKSLINVALQADYVRTDLSRRLLTGSTPSLPVVVDPDTGEKLRLPAPAETSNAWTEEEARKFKNRMNAGGWSDSELLAALGVEKFMLWTGSAQDAANACEDWITEQIRQEEAETRLSDDPGGESKPGGA